MLDKFEGKFPKFTASNSFSAGGYVFYYKKIDGSYVVYEYKTRIKILATNTKKRARETTISKIDEIRRRLNAVGV